MVNTERKIQDVMTKKLITVSPDDDFLEMKELFLQNDFHHLLVVGDRNELVGIISKEDLWRTAYHVSLVEKGKNLSKGWYENYQVKHMMTKNPMTIDPEDTLGLAADIFNANKFRALPVVDNDKLVGIITPYDLMKFAFQNISIA